MPGKEEKAPGKGTVILRKTGPEVCGGTDTTLDSGAPREILSEEMTVFDVSSALPVSGRESERFGEPLGAVSAFAARAEGGSFLCLETRPRRRGREPVSAAWALVREDVMPALVRLVREERLAEKNGRHSFTHGLPENFGGSVDIRYAGGERISFSDNQRPILSRETGARIARLFGDAMAGERVPLPALSELRAIRFLEKREDGGFTEANLTILPGGGGTIFRRARYGGEQPVYESEVSLGEAAVAAIRKAAGDCGLLAWPRLPEGRYGPGEYKSLALVFTEGTELTVRRDRALPAYLAGGFFDLELALTVKNWGDTE